MALKYSARLRKAIIKRRPTTGWNVHQFGQKNSYTTFGGATGCTHTFLQWIIYLWTGKKVTHDEISRAAKTYPLRQSQNPQMRGLYASEVQRVIAHYNLPYRVAYNLTAAEVRKIAQDRGPVGFGHAYSHWPEWKGYRYGNIHADGKPNGYAQPSGKAGKNQLAGFTGAHMSWLLGIATSPTETDKVYCCEPNHGSAARPQKPPYDVMTVAQFDRAYNSYHNVLGRSPYAVIPTKVLPAAGY